VGDSFSNSRDTKKSGKIIIIIVGVLALALGVWRIGYGIKAPYLRKTNADQFVFKTEEQLAEEQKKTDTDGDGLNDYEEINIYATSAYLKDSDSDGIDDKTEIDKGTDPNCPEGKDCHGDNLVNPEAVSTSTASGIILPVGDSSEGASASGPVTLTPEQIRAMLRESGAPEESLKKISDEELMKIYAESVKQVAEEETAN